jgi:50S ribosome-binding GTPase
VQRVTAPSLRPPQAPQPVSPLIAGLCEELAADPPFGGEPAAELLDIADQCREPLRVAVAGDVSTGKSTLVNALLCTRRAAVAWAETTARVTSYRHPMLPPPRAAVPGHRYEAVPFPWCDRLILIDTPGLNSPSGKERVTQEMISGATRAAGSTAVLLYLCKDCVVSAGALTHIEAFRTLTTGRTGSGLNVVLVGAKADSIQGSRVDIEKNLKSEGRIPCAGAVAVSQQAAMAARTGLLTESHLNALKTISQDDRLTDLTQNGLEALARGWAGRGFDSSAVDQLKALTESPGVLHDSVLRIRQRQIANLSDLICTWEHFSGLAALEQLLARYASDADMYTVFSATGRIRRLALGLGSHRGGILRDKLAAIEQRPAYAALLRREAAAVLETGALAEVPESDRAEAAAILRDPVSAPRLSVAVKWQRMTLIGRSSLARQIASMVVSASLNPSAEKG